ncbi:MAG: PqqD family protein [bacterium]|nr:PqqD family protein [Candidatus Minthenecus merdequi]
MKIKKGFMLCPTMGKTMVITTEELAKDFSGMIKMNEQSTDIWKWIEAGKERNEIIALYAETYDIDTVQAENEVDWVIKQMADAGILE